MSETEKPPASPGPAQQAISVPVDETGLQPMYMNFCRVTGTPEEIILDFGLNAEPFKRNSAPVKLTQRMVCNFYTAKRLLMALSVAVQRHEADFGMVETDVTKRVRRAPGSQDAPLA